MTEQPSPFEPNIRAEHYYLLRAVVRCARCGLSTSAVAFGVPFGHETLDDDEGNDAWQSARCSALMFYVQRLPASAQAHARRISPQFRLAFDPDYGSPAWFNHCEHCQAQLDEHDLHCEPDGAFVPTTIAQAGAIELRQIDEAFTACADGYAPEPEFWASLRRV
jgi:hypothetical protein